MRKDDKGSQRVRLYFETEGGRRDRRLWAGRSAMREWTSSRIRGGRKLTSLVSLLTAAGNVSEMKL